MSLQRVVRSVVIGTTAGVATYLVTCYIREWWSFREAHKAKRELAAAYERGCGSAEESYLVGRLVSAAAQAAKRRRNLEELWRRTLPITSYDDDEQTP